MSSRVVITASHLPKFAYGALSEDEKRMLVDYLMAARAHVLIDQWCLADHFLACVQHHPEIPKGLAAAIEATSLTT